MWRWLASSLPLLLLGCPPLEETRGEYGVLSFSTFDSDECASQCSVPDAMSVRSTWHIAVRSEGIFVGTPDASGVSVGDWELVHWCRTGSRSQRLDSPDAPCDGTASSVMTVDIHSGDEAGAAALVIRDPDGMVIDRITFEVVDE